MVRAKSQFRGRLEHIVRFHADPQKLKKPKAQSSRIDRQQGHNGMTASHLARNHAYNPPTLSPRANAAILPQPTRWPTNNSRQSTSSPMKRLRQPFCSHLVATKVRPPEPQRAAQPPQPCRTSRALQCGQNPKRQPSQLSGRIAARVNLTPC